MTDEASSDLDQVLPEVPLATARTSLPVNVQVPEQTELRDNASDDVIEILARNSNSTRASNQQRIKTKQTARKHTGVFRPSTNNIVQTARKHTGSYSMNVIKQTARKKTRRVLSWHVPVTRLSTTSSEIFIENDLAEDAAHYSRISGEFKCFYFVWRRHWKTNLGKKLISLSDCSIKNISKYAIDLITYSASYVFGALCVLIVIPLQYLAFRSTLCSSPFFFVLNVHY